MTLLLTPRTLLVLVAAALAAGAAPKGGTAKAAPSFVYFGTYTGAKSRGIYVSTFDGAAGRLGTPRLAAETESPSFLALHPTRSLLYAVNEVDSFEGQKAGAVSAFAIDPATGDLRALGRASSGGGGPCHLSVDHGGRHVLVANYGGGSVASLAIKADGGVEAPSSFVQHQGSSTDPKRQTRPHAHMIETDPANSFALAADLGLDEVLVYRFDPRGGGLQPADPPFARVAPGSGPRHFAFSPDGRDLYVLNEMRITVAAFKYGAGRLTEFQTVSALPAGKEPTPDDSGAEIMVHPSGRFVYASLRGPDSIAVFARDAATGKVTPVEHTPAGGHKPRGFAIDPSGRWLLAAHQTSDSVAVFKIDPDTGRLSATGQTIEIGAPVSVAFFGGRSRP